MKNRFHPATVGTRCRASLTFSSSFASRNQRLVGRGVLTAPPPIGVVRAVEGGFGTARPTTDRFAGNSARRTAHPFPGAVVLALLLLFVTSAHAQWQTQTLPLKAGWNAVYLHVDASHATLDALVGADATNLIQEVWLWQPAPATIQFVQSPQLPTGAGSQWLSWVRPLGPSSALQRLVGNAAYLVRASADYTWNLKGRPVPFSFLWSSTGLNFLGFPTPATGPPSFENLLTPAPIFQQNAQIFYYQGGDLGVTNPVRLATPRTYPVRRGEAYWMRSGDTFNRYFGPFEITLTSSAGLQFRDNLGQSRLRLRNLTSGSLTVALRLLASETPPAGQPALAGTPPLLLRGALNTTNLTYASTNLSVGGPANTFALAAADQPGSEVEVVIGLNRSLLTGPSGAAYAGILRFTDSLNLSQQDVPVGAEVASNAGLWVGAATVSRVQSYLKSYQKSGSTNVIGTNNAYIVTTVNTNLGAVARSMPLRLILHTDNTNASLLQRVYYGLNPGTNYVNATRESLLDPKQLATARRVSAIHLPVTPTNTVWRFSGPLQAGTSLTTTVRLEHSDHASNPFLHTYHPDHDNLDAKFQQPLAPGFESYTITRVITLTITPPGNDFVSLTSSGQVFTGVYAETVTLAGKGAESRTFATQGTFSLNRINRIGTLTTQ